MARIPWTTLSGEDVESIVALLINSEYYETVRITPSQGDGGVDILHRDKYGPGKDAVYQVKKFSTQLKHAQKKQIINSIKAVLKDPRWKSLQLNEWNLVMPLDPTPEALEWFNETLSQHGLTGNWLGKTYVEQLAAKHPQVIDYYLQDNRERNEKLIKAIITLSSAGNYTDLSLKDQVCQIQSAISALQNDPFYEFQVHLGKGVPPILQSRQIPHLVTSTLLTDAENTSWAIVDFIAKTRESTNISPIQFTGELKTSTKIDELNAFFDYGIPFSDLEFSGSIEAPGGFVEQINEGKISLLPINNTFDSSSLFRFSIEDPFYNELASINVIKSQVNSGNKGIHVELVEENKIFKIEIIAPYSNPDKCTFAPIFEHKFIFTHDPNAACGLPVTTVQQIYHFLTQCKPPNKGYFGSRHAWTKTKEEIQFLEQILGIDEELGKTLTQLAFFIKNLSIIQEHTAEIIKVPEIKYIDQSLYSKCSFIAKLLSEKTLAFRFGEEERLIFKSHDVQISVTEKTKKLRLELPLRLDLPGTTLDLGSFSCSVLNPTITQVSNINGVQTFAVDSDSKTYTLEII
ncbi:restriction endonuclease [Corynebacterium freiburgense]|uniref:restriction endonuclease n=1 Tax=Corynebacterium freiburgense TaxID=556548 RepID=UPI000415F567|nr:restriction endonuclease [Corynebacterium freiburgense]WJZ03241.1 hypothetical protein CFREI_09820 [Corynebacterium freiburgense]